MRAAIFKGAGEPVAIEDVPDPEPLADEVVIRVGRCGVCGTDVHMTSGHSDFALPAGSRFGHEFAGEIVALGRDVSDFKIGDRIAAMPAIGCGRCEYCVIGSTAHCPNLRTMGKGFAEYLSVAASVSVKLPQSLSLADGALVEPLAVGLHGIVQGNVQSGTRVLVLGAGSVGLAAVFWARRMGAGRIVAASPSVRRAEMAAALGADAFETLGEGEQERIYRSLGGAPDVVLECAGAVGATAKAIELVRPLGTVVSMGFCTSPDPIVPALATLKQATIKFSLVYSYDEFRTCVDVLDSGQVEPRQMITETVSLDAFPAALEALRNGSPQTKVHVDPWMG